MKTWDDYKDHVKAVDPESKKDIEEAENFQATWSEAYSFSIKTNHALITAKCIVCGQYGNGFIFFRFKKTRYCGDNNFRCL